MMVVRKQDEKRQEMFDPLAERKNAAVNSKKYRRNRVNVPAGTLAQKNQKLMTFILGAVH